MKLFSGPARIASFILIGIGIGLLALNIFLKGTLNIALPLVFLMLGGLFFILAMAAGEKPRWVTLLYVPGAMLLALGLIFLINILTQDWNAWAYAWLLFATGIGAGLILANRRQVWPQVIDLIGWGMIAGGLTFFAIFGAIAGGLFIQVMAPILIILGGLTLYWVRPENIFPEHMLRRFKRTNQPASFESQKEPASEQLVDPLIEQLSSREIEVLQLINDGLSNQQIANRLNIASSTVKTHINNIYGKLGVQTRVQAIHRARDLGLLVLLLLLGSMPFLSGCTAQGSIPVSHRWASISGGEIEKSLPGEEFYFTVPVDKTLFEPVVIPIQINVSGSLSKGGLRFELRQPNGQVVWTSGDLEEGNFSISTSYTPNHDVTGNYVLGLVWEGNTSAQYNLSWKALRLGPAVLISGTGMLLVALGFIVYSQRQRLGWRYLGLGALFWVFTVALKFVFAALVNPTVYQLLNVSHTNLFAPGNLISYLYIGSLTGFFESGVAYLVLRKLQWGKASWNQAMAFGIGFGAVEAALLGMLSFGTAVTALVAPDSLPVPALGSLAQSANLVMGTAPVLERISVITAHIFACVLLFYAIARKEVKWAWISILYKTILDAPAGFAAFWGVNTAVKLWTIELIIMVIALIGLWGIVFISLQYPRPEQEVILAETSGVD